MRLFGRGASAAVSVEPQQLLPGGELIATVTIPDAFDKVATATAVLGYENTYAYRWAGRADAAATSATTSLATIGDVGTDYGSERVTSDWVAVIATELPLAGDTLEAGTHELAFRVPSWAPGSSEQLAAWAVRLSVDRKGRDVGADGPFTVLAPPPADPPPAEQERVLGASTDIDIRLDRPCWRAGETITGTVAITARETLPEADVAVVLEFDRLSHPLERTPAQCVTFDRGRVQLDKHLALPPNAATELPFEIALPADAPPSAEGVHSTLCWYVLVRILYKGLIAPMPERVRRGFVVYNAPAGGPIADASAPNASA
ncbi:MAG: hypothetical protein QOI73_3649 [Solirubrobacteraceae bacterium]|nr:hypothetical protein [Solirubrobacteraceae bacterium]